MAYVDPVEVLKAAHTYQDLVASGPGWSYSTARHLIVDPIRAAIEHLPVEPALRAFLAMLTRGDVTLVGAFVAPGLQAVRTSWQRTGR